MATLFNTKISETYEGLFKTIDNAAITASLKELTDGSGNQSGLYVNNAGDFKVSNILEWGSLKDTGTGVTITRYVTSTDGIENFDNNTSLPTSAAVKLYVDSKFATSDTLQEVLSFGNTTGGNDIVVSASDDITFTDSSKAIFGASSDLQIYHDGSNSFIRDTGTGDLKIQSNRLWLQSSTGEAMGRFTENGSAELYYDNVLRLSTTNTGVDVTGNLVVSGSITGAGGSFLPLAGGTMTGDVVFNDDVKLKLGSGNDLRIYHDGTDSLIRNETGNLYIRNNSDDKNIIFQSDNNSGGLATYILIDGVTGAVELNHYGSKKLETTSTGVAVTGALSTTTDVTVGANATFVDNGKAIFGAGSDLQIYHNGTNQDKIESLSSFLILESSNLILRNNGGSEDYAKFFGNGGAEIYYDNTKRLETVIDGAKVTGNLEVTGTITGSGGSFLPLAGGTMTGNTIHNDNVKSIYGTGGDLEIYHDGSNSYIADTGTGTLNLRGSTQVLISGANGEVGVQYVENAGVGLRHNNVTKLSTISSGITVTGNGVFSGNVSVPDSAFLYAGSSDDLTLTHNGTDSIIRNYTGDFQINQGAVTKSIVFKTSDANALDTTALTISRNADASFGRDVTIAGDLTVNGTTTTVNSQTLAVVDPLIQLAKDNTANSLDIGLYGDYNDGTDRFLGLFSDASDSNKFKLFKGTTVEPTTTVNIGATGYEAADLVLANLEATGDITLGDDLNFSTNGFADISNTGTGSMRFKPTSQTLALTLTGSNAFFAGDVNVGEKLLMNNNRELRWLDSGGTERTVLELNSSDDLYLGKSGGGNLYLVNGTSYTTAVTIDSSQNATFAGYVKAPFFTSDGGRSFKMDGVAFEGGYSNGADANGANDLGSTTNQWRDVFISGSITSSGGGASFAGNIITTGTSFIGKASTSSYLPDDGVFGGIITNGGGFKITTQAVDTLTLSAVGGNMTVRGGGTFGGDVTINGAGSASNGSISLVSSDSFIRINTTGGTTDKGKWDIRTVSASGFEALDFRTVNDANNVFSTKLSIATDGNVTISGTTNTISTYGSAYNQQLYNAPSFSQGVWQVAGVSKALVGAGSTGMIINTAGNATAPIIFSTGSATTERMRINSSGTIAIGPDAQDIQLSPASTSGGTNLIYLRGNALGDKAEISLNHYGYANMYIGMGKTANTVMSLTATSGGTDGIIIDTSGNVGIGMVPNTSYSKLQVKSPASSYGFDLIGRDAGVNGESQITFWNSNQGTQLAAIFNTADNLGFVTGTTERMRITSNGSIYNGLTTNTHFGLDALSNTTTADESTAFGNYALRAQQTGRNTAVGYHTLQDLTTGNYNTVVGGEAGENITVGNFNVGMGSFALRNATDISDVVAIGYKALYDLTTGGSNTAVGANAGENLTTGGSNTLIGTNAGDSMTDGEGNVCIGRLAYQAGSNNNNTIVGMQAGYTANQSNAVIIGYKSGWVNNGNSNVFVGAESGRNNTSGSSNLFIGTDAGYANIDGNSNTYVGIAAGTYQKGAGNVSMGHQAMYGVANATNSSNNVVIGYQAGKNITTGGSNTLIGYHAGLSSQTASSNVFIGQQNFALNTTGGSNVGVGLQAGYNNTVGIQNTYLGYAAGYGQTGNTGNANTAIGNYSQKDRAGGSGNTSVGHYALGSDVNAGFNASDNTAVGTFAGKFVTTGALNTFLGYNAGERITSGGNNTLLGRGAGTGTSPSGQLTSESNRVCLGNNSVSHLYCKISTITTSDKRDKTNFGDISYGLDFVNQLKPTAFEFKKDGSRDTEETDGVKRYGFLAQDILELEGDNPVIINNDDKENLKYQESHLVPVLVKAIQELKAEVDSLKQKCNCKN